ncbi:hypothetical protein [Bradyrhizobium sp. SZCCHNR2009]|uniref:hypothetical protein n=1 Tax=Bradyrhizobium sp. SZCCHNR2009 TaxID=3057375 RepID=UPI0028EB502C|nr:hypothetical protein [Bradyrhizobium sp. SZCCHNR2009]
MVEIISKRDGPRREDVAAKEFIRTNRATIDKIANRLTGGQWQAMRHPVAAPQPEASGRLWYTPPRRASSDVSPYVRISLNGRIVVADLASGRQIHFIGELRGSGHMRRLALATSQNGLFDPLDDQLHAALADLEGLRVPDEASEESLERELAIRLGIEVLARGE